MASGNSLFMFRAQDAVTRRNSAVSGSHDRGAQRRLDRGASAGLSGFSCDLRARVHSFGAGFEDRRAVRRGRSTVPS